MAYCIKCGNLLESGSNFCKSCGTRVSSDSEETVSERKQEFLGKIIKCPSCGAEVPSMSAICPDCGHEFNSVKISESLNNFITKINDCDNQIASEPKTKKGWSSWSKCGKFLWVILNLCTLCIPLIIYMVMPLITINKQPTLSVAEQRKYNLISNFVFPNDKSSIIEAIRFIQGKIKAIASSSIIGNNLYWANVWNNKAIDLGNQANLVLKNDSMVNFMISDINQSMAAIKKKVRNKALIFVGIMIIMLLILIGLYNSDDYVIDTESTNSIQAEHVAFSGWISDNYKIGEQGCFFYVKENGKVGAKIDVICVKDAQNEIEDIIKADKRNPNDFSLDDGTVYINNYDISFGSYSDNSDSTEIQIFIQNLLAMDVDSERIYEIELDPQYSTDRKELFDVSSILFKIELKYEEINGYHIIYVK